MPAAKDGPVFWQRKFLLVRCAHVLLQVGSATTTAASPMVTLPASYKSSQKNR